VPSIWRRLVSRFALIAFSLYHIPLFLNDYPTLGGDGFRDDGPAHVWGHIFGQVGLWVARNVFGMAGPMPAALDGDNGDTAEEFCRLLVGVVIALIVAIAWTIADRRRPRARWVDGALRLVLRYSIILGLASYGLAKLYPVQFNRLSPLSLELRVGELSPFALLWRFMEYSRVYNTFAGAMEMAVVVLLSFRRTSTLGALLCIPVLTNVALMDLCYGVPVKLFSISMVVSSAVIVLYDARRLADALLFWRAVPAPLPAPRWPYWLERLRWPLKVLLIGGVLVSSAVGMAEQMDKAAAQTSSPLYGAWDVQSQIVNGRELAHTAEPTRWRRLAEDYNVLAIRMEDDTLVRCSLTVDQAAHTAALDCAQTKQQGSLHWTRTGNTLQLQGTFDNAAISVSLTQRDLRQLPLLKSEFQWIQD
jgi:hypothetical protein